MIRVLLGFLLGAVTVAAAAAAPAAPDPEVVPGAWIVRLEPDAPRGPVEAFARRAGARVHLRLASGRVLSVRGLTAPALAGLLKIPGVEDAEPELAVSADMFHSMGVVHAWSGTLAAAGLPTRGRGVRVCVIDTGVDPNHILIQGRVDTASGFDFVNLDANAADDQGHGSHVAGIVASTDAYLVNGLPYSGMAPEAIIVPVKVLDANGDGSTADVIAGIDYCSGLPVTLGDGTEVRIRRPADVISMSLSTKKVFMDFCDSDAVAAAANDAVARGFPVISSTGNAGRNNAIGSPACGTSVIAVGATYDEAGRSFSFQGCSDSNTQVDELACFSNAGPQIDVTAPGCEIHSISANTGIALGPRCGTSQAVPHVAGLAALALQMDACGTPADLTQAIRAGAVDRGPVGFDTGYGWGRIDALGTLTLISAGLRGNDTLTVSGAGATVVSFDPLPGAATYDIARGQLSSLSASGGPGGTVSLGALTCIENDSVDTTTATGGPGGHADTAAPPSGDGFFYLFRKGNASPQGGYGGDSLCRPRSPGPGDCP